MPIIVRHSKVVTIPDDGQSPVGTDEWNAPHTITGLDASGLGFTPVGSVSAVNVQDAIEELDTEKASIANLAALAFSGAIADLSFAGTTGIFDPVLTFSTPGNLAVAYSTQSGFYTKIGDLVFTSVRLVTSSFTWSTSSGPLQIAALPFDGYVDADISYRGIGSMRFGGINKTGGYTQIVPSMGSAAGRFLQFTACGMGVAESVVVAADVPSGGAVTITLSLLYKAAA